MNEILTVKQLVAFAAASYGEKSFCRFFRGEELCEKSYNEFYSDCLSVCRYIRAIEERRIHIAFIGKTSYEYIACLTGMIFSGNTVVPFDPNITVSEAETLFEDADIEMIFCEDAFLEKAREISEKLGCIKKLVSLGDWKWFDEVFTNYNGSGEYASLSDFEEKPDDCALIVYTSGTTGVRKGVMLSNRNIAANTCYNEFIADEDDIEFSVLPMHHVFCYCCDVLKTVYDGGVLCLNGELPNLYKNMPIFEPSIMRIVPALCKSLLTRIKITHRKNPSLTKREAAELVCGRNFKRMIAGSAFLSGAVIDELAEYGITARQGYGMSECSPRISTADFSDECKYSNGRVLSVNRVRCVDGEIQVKGESVMLGYYKKPEATKEAFTRDGWLHTGDLGYLEGDHIYLVGRKKNLLILSNGENISPEKIENRFADDALVKEIVVFAENDRIIAEIFPDYDLAKAAELEDIDGEIEKIVDRVNEASHSDEQIYQFRIRKTPFVRTSTGKIKRTEFYF